MCERLHFFVKPKKKSGRPESNRRHWEFCRPLQSHTLTTELQPAFLKMDHKLAQEKVNVNEALTLALEQVQLAQNKLQTRINRVAMLQAHRDVLHMICTITEHKCKSDKCDVCPAFLVDSAHLKHLVQNRKHYADTYNIHIQSQDLKFVWELEMKHQTHSWDLVESKSAFMSETGLWFKDTVLLSLGLNHDSSYINLDPNDEEDTQFLDTIKEVESDNGKIGLFQQTAIGLVTSQQTWKQCVKQL